MNTATKKRIRPKKHLFTYATQNIVIAGSERMRSKLLDVEKNFNVDLIFAHADDVEKAVNQQTIAIMVDERMARKVEYDLMQNLLSNYKLLPIFYLSRKTQKQAFYLKLYEQGVYGVIDWPSDAGELAGIVTEVLKPHENVLGKTKGDKQISKLIKAHIAFKTGLQKMKVKVIEGFVFLEGKVKSLYQKKLIEDEISDVLGVKKIITKDVNVVDTKSMTDHEIEREINVFCSKVLGPKKKSMSVRVEEGRVEIMGAAVDREDVAMIENYAMKLSGVKRVNLQVIYKPSMVARNINRAKLLEKRVKELFKGVKSISIKIYGDFAEVSGTAKIRADRALVERYLLQVLPVKSVVNKMYVA